MVSFFKIYISNQVLCEKHITVVNFIDKPIKKEDIFCRGKIPNKKIKIIAKFEISYLCNLMVDWLFFFFFFLEILI